MFFWSRHFRFGHPCRKLLPKIRNFFLQNQQTVSSFCFFSKKKFVPECFSGHMECEVDNTAKTVLPRNWLFLAYCPKVKMFWFQPFFFLEMFRWTRRMHSWFVQLFFWKICGHVDYGFDKLGGDLFQGFGIFSLKVRKNIQNIQNNQFTPHVALVTWNAVFATGQNLFRLKTRNTLARSADVRKILFLPVFLSIEMFDWTLRTSIWRTRCFLESQNFLEKNREKI